MKAEFPNIRIRRRAAQVLMDKKGRREPPNFILARGYAAELGTVTMRSSGTRYVAKDGISLGTRF